MHTQSREIAHGSTMDARQPAPASGLWWVASGCAAVLLLVVLGAFIDQVDEQRLLAEQQAFAAGRRAGHADMIASTETAWKVAQTEADRCTRAKP